MITEIPSPQEFAQASLDLLHLAWTIAARTLEELDASEVASWDEDGSAADAYLTSAQPELGNAVALVLPAQAMGLKGRIAKISPFLIIARDPRDWPRQCDSSDVSFADFRSADAADLIRIHDTVGDKRIAPEFASLFNMVRRRRNVLVHSVSKSERIRPPEVIRYIFQTISHLHDKVYWPRERVRYLSDSPLSPAWSSDFSYGTVLTEIDSASRC